MHPVERTYHVLGVRLRSGSLYPGNGNDAQACRDANVVARLQAAGCKVFDDGDVAIPSYLPHHSLRPQNYSLGQTKRSTNGRFLQRSPAAIWNIPA